MSKILIGGPASGGAGGISQEVYDALLESYTDQLSENARINLGLAAETANVLNGDTFGVDYISEVVYEADESVQSTILDADVSNGATSLSIPVVTPSPPVSNGWVPSGTGSGASMGAAAYGNGVYIVITTNGYFVTNTDLTLTDNQTVTIPSTTGPVDVIFDGTQFVFATSGGIYTSTAGEAPVNRYSTTGMNHLAYNGTTYVAMKKNSDIILTSTDGITWTERTGASSDGWNRLTYGNGEFLAIARQGATYYEQSSPDGITWTGGTNLTYDYWRDIAFGNGIFVAIAEGGTTDKIAVGTSHNSFTLYDALEGSYSIAFGNGYFLLGGTGDSYYSTDGINWTITATPPTTNGLSMLDYVSSNEFICGYYLGVRLAIADGPVAGDSVVVNIGDEITIQDSVNKESFVISNIVDETITFTPALSNSYTVTNEVTIYDSYVDSPSGVTTYDLRNVLTSNGTNDVDFVVIEVEHTTTADIDVYISITDGTADNFVQMTQGTTQVIDGTTSKTDYTYTTLTPNATVKIKVVVNSGIANKIYGSLNNE